MKKSVKFISRIAAEKAEIKESREISARESRDMARKKLLPIDIASVRDADQLYRSLIYKTE